MIDEFFERIKPTASPLTPEPPVEQEYSAKSLSLCSTKAARALLDYRTAAAFGVLPLGIIETAGRTIFSAACGHEDHTELQAALRFSTGMDTKLLPVPAGVLPEAIFKAYHRDDEVLRQRGERARDATAAEPHESSAPAFHPPSGEAASFLASLIEFAIAQQASDIHLIPTARGALIRLRIDGRLCENDSVIDNRRFHQQLITRLKVLANLSIAQSFAPQDGRFEAPMPDRRLPVRLSLMPTVHGEKAVLRLLGSHRPMGLEDLRMNPRALRLLHEVIDCQQGTVLFSGPTGSGKTSSIYAVLNQLAAANLNIITIEDPVEIELHGVSQTSIDAAHGLGYGECLRSVLRQDPDVIVLGEIRDGESAAMALHAALTGHLVLSTVHARNVFEVLLRLAHFRLDQTLLAQGLNLLFSQRLIPKLCERCKVIDLTASQGRNCKVYQEVGCAACDYTGFQGRTLAVEAFRFDPDTARRLATGQLHPAELPQVTAPHNYVPLCEDLAMLLDSGQISWKHFTLYANSGGGGVTAPDTIGAASSRSEA